MDFSISLETARDALHCIPAEDRGTWVKMGLALFDEFGDAAFDTWHDWSKGASNYKEKSAISVWRSLSKAGGASRATIASVIYEAKNYGFKLSRSQQVTTTAAERQRLNAEREARREAQRLAEEAAARAAAEKAAAIWSAAGPAPADHPYLKRKNIGPHCARWVDSWVKEYLDSETGEIAKRTVRDVLLVPIWAAPGRLSSLQAIFPSSKNTLRRDKDYMTDGRKHGCYCLIGKVTQDTHTIVVCEGFATGASIHEATGLPVMVAFDSSNLAPVCESLRSKLPGATLLVAADNDQFTKNARGEPWNPGVEAATKAVNLVRGVLAVPTFTSLEGEPTDYNDLAAQAGLEAVRSQLELALSPAPAPAPEEGPAPWDDDPDDTAPPPAPAPPAPPTESDLDRNGHFTILGYEHRRHYVFAHGKRQILEFTVGELSMATLIELAPINWWEMNFPGSGKDPVDRNAVVEFFVRTAERRGIYDIGRVRGRGAWVDDGRMVYHHGGYLTVDGVATEVTRINSRYVYELNGSLPDPAETPLSTDDGKRIVDLAGMFRWSQPGSAALLAGWVALAPICGALKWRPHVWMTGGAGSGKTTVLNEFVHHLLGGLDIFAQGNSSEAGIRQTLKADARPVLFDESEQNDDREKMRVQNILSLIRQSSTESQAQTLKGTAGGDAQAYHIRSMFCLASIQVGMRHQADVERISVLTLRPKREDTDAGGTWKTIRAELDALHRDADLPARLFRRMLDQLPVVLQNVKVFATVGARVFGTQREGDQYGTLLAGAWSLISSAVATEDQAHEFIGRYDWAEHAEASDTDESQKAMAALMERSVRINGGGELSVFELAREAAGLGPTNGVGPAIADAVLQRHGMRVRTKAGRHRLVLSNSSQALQEMMDGTPFGADMRGLLLRLPGADRCNNKPERFSGVTSKCYSIPLDGIVDGGGTAPESADGGMDWEVPGGAVDRF